MTEARHRGGKASWTRVRLIGRHALGEALHLRLALLLGLVGGAFVLGSRWLRHFNFGATELKFVADFGLGAISLFGTLLAALATAQLFFSDLETRAVYCVLTRPVRRWEYVVGKFLGAAGLLALFTAALGALLGVLLIWRGAQLDGTVTWETRLFLGACALLWLKFTLVAAMTLVVCSYAGSALFASCLGLLMALVAQLRGLHGDAGWLRVWPDLSLYDAEAVLAAGQMPDAAWLAALGLHWVAYVAIFGALASYAFSCREF